ncbi:MAG: ribonuclease H-like domain-containing protein [Dissulfuribacterales bacterium]
MLLSTFQHIKGIGKITELALWDKGITTWEKYIKNNGRQLSLFQKETMTTLNESIKAYKNSNLAFFANRLPCSEYYRIALTYPQDIIFLDIETTGLSLYYDQITLVGWSIGRKYGVSLKDEDESGLLAALNSAKAIVTFNGILFDIKFLKKAFPGICIPPVHIDLRFFAKRAGLSGGQKAIEPQIGYKRPELIEGMEGESAPILWYKYRRGDKASLKKLVTYNHADIEGMKWIFDYTIEKIYDINKIPNKIRSKPKFSKFNSKINWANRKPKKRNSYRVYLTKFLGNPKPLITYAELNKIVSLSNITCIGIDLVSSEDRESGYCILKGNKAKTFRIKSDDEMILLAQEAGATLISIDSPLTIPKGRNTYFDDDPNRAEFGIMRQCERILKKRGVNVYPCLIPSMQKLTRRGIQLSDKFRKLGIPVIESYPGAAQDILAIPRKRAGLNYLAASLAEFGIFDNFTEKNISHDELDAITSSIVGIFFWVGKFEGLGNIDEEYLIIPDLNANAENWRSRKVIGISGTIGSGKSTATEYLKDKGFISLRFSQILENILEDRNEEITRSNLQKIGYEIHNSPGQRWLEKKLIEELPKDKNIVIDGLRFPEDHAFMVETFGPSFIHLHIETAIEFLISRIKNGETNEIPIKKALNNPIESNIKDLKKLSSYTIINDGSISELYSKVNSFL